MSKEQLSPLSTHIQWNEVTWYSRLGAIILFVGALPVLSFYIGTQYVLSTQQDIISIPRLVTDSPGVSNAIEQISNNNVRVTSISLTPASRGWEAGTQVTIYGSGFTKTSNKIYTTDGAHESYLLTAGSADGSEIIFSLPPGFHAPEGTGIRVKNVNGMDDDLHLPPGESVLF